jgi:hypothetical protein
MKKKIQILFVFVFLLLVFCYRKEYKVKKTSIIRREINNDFIDNIYSKYNYVKNVPQKYKNIFGFICYYYPELKNEKIFFKKSNIKTTMETRPKISFNKEYLIILNSNHNNTGINFDEIPKSAKIGLLAHEFSHILDYKEKKMIDIICLGFQILFDNKRENYEKSIDELTIIKGFGEYLKEWAQFSMYSPKISKKYRKIKIKYYLKPKEIDSIIKMYTNCD